MKGKYQGIDNLELDLPSQVEYNRQKNVTQDTQISVLSSQVNEILSQRPSGFLPRVYYGLTQGPQTYRFLPDAVINVSGLSGVVGDAFEFVSDVETTNYIPAIAIMINSTQVKINVQGDYNVSTTEFDIVNMRTGAVLQNEDLGSVLATQYASYLGDYDPQTNADKQITVLYDLEFNAENVIFASVDFNSDDVFNWIRIGGYSNGVDGHSIWSAVNATAATVFASAKVGDTVIAGEAFTYGGVSLDIGDMVTIDSLSPLTVTSQGNVRGPQGDQGVQGNPGINGTNGLTPTIVNDYWYIGGVDTGVKALGEDGQNGQNGQSFQMHSGLYSTDDNWGEAGNVGPNSEVLLQLPTLPQASGMTGYAYVVYDPLTTPLEPYYDLYYANDNDNDWTIIHPFSGIKGQDGAKGETPYISGGYWYIGGVNTGVSATGPQGPDGDPALFYLAVVSLASTPFNAVLNKSYFSRTPVAGDYFTLLWKDTSTSHSYIVNARVSSISGSNVTIYPISTIDTTGAQGTQGSTGPTGATPNISMAATALAYGQSPTVVKTGTNENPIFTLGIPEGAPGQGVPSGGTTGQILKKTSNSDYATSWYSLGSGDITGALGYTPYNSTNPSGYISSTQLLDLVYPVGSYRMSINSNETSFLGGSWTLVASNVKLPLGDEFSVKGNGKTLGLTNGSKNFGMSPGNSTGYVYFGTGIYNQNVSTATSWSGTNEKGLMGVTTDATKSGLVANAGSSISGLYIYRRTA